MASECTTATFPVIAAFTEVYPSYRRLINGFLLIPLSARSLVIKACQAQRWPTPGSFSTLRTMIERHPPVFIRNQGNLQLIPLSNFLPFYGVSLEDPLESAIVLDIARGLPLSTHQEVRDAKEQSWGKEVGLLHGVKRENRVNWDIFFAEGKQGERLYPDLEPNLPMARRIFFQLGVFRERIRGTRLFPRATHKNMSRSTRRNYENIFDESLEEVPIFGQDNWQYVYHHTGVMLEGSSEMRQKWYHHAAKPRTYFAMGGTAYRDCRFLQDFFTRLVDHFVPTNHKTRLQPDRLYMSSEDDKEDPHFRIYDLSSFTSNMSEQLPFMLKMAEFFRGVEVEIVDERSGLLSVDLGSLLDQYNQTCVELPEVSLERYIRDECIEADDLVYPHCVASLLGIFGNLMSCTLAHYFIISPVLQNEEEGNVAGDDGIIPEDACNPYPVHRVIDLVGSCAMEKTFRSDEEAAICLKRPIEEKLPRVTTFFNIIPPSLVRFLQMSNCRDPSDSRYPRLFSEPSKYEAISTLGKDLLRFLRSAYLRQYEDVDRLTEVLRGFQRLVWKIHKVHVVPQVNLGPNRYTWPAEPNSYDFLACPPASLLGIYYLPRSIYVGKLETRPEYQGYLYAGLCFESNTSKKLQLLERLGYVEKEMVMETYEKDIALNYYMVLISPNFVPMVYSYRVIRDVPESFQYW